VHTLSGAVDPLERGLPRGRASLPPKVVRDRQRERLIRGAIAAVDEKGYAAATVADVVAAARVSRKAFYEHFAGKEECLLVAATTGIGVMASRLADVEGEGEGGGALRAAVRAYLELCASEPVFTRVLFLEMPAVGAPARPLRAASFGALADMLRRATGRPELPEWVYPAAVGAAYELILRALETSDDVDFGALEDPVVDVIERLLA
jgi:AcrR family transcriptional regulator